MSTSNKKRKNANYKYDPLQEPKLPKEKRAAGGKGPRLSDSRFVKFLTSRTNILDQNPNKKPFNYCILGFLIPFVFAGLGVLIRAYAMEHGSTSIFSLLFSDAYYQYFPFVKAFRSSLLSGDSMLYTWKVGMGTDFTGLFAYYLGSPLNLLSVFIPEAWLLDYYTFMVVLRIGLAGLFFSIFLKNVFDRNDITIAIFGAFYATCAWVCGYMWNVMWLDTFALLPLVALGTCSLLNRRKYILYTVSLFFSVFINYYIGFFTCIFTLLVFICYQICRWENFKKFFIDLGLMALFTCIAIGGTAILSLPTLACLATTSAGSSEFPSKFFMHIADEQSFKGLWTSMVKVATNTFAAITPNVKDAASKGGLPNLYCGVFALIFSFLFLTCKQVKWRDRICALVLLLFLNLSFIIKQLDYIWHGFHMTNEIPNRFSFLYSFVMLYMAYRAWLLRRHFKPWQILTAMVLVTVMLFVSPGFATYREAVSDPSFQKALSTFFSTWDFGTAFEDISAEALFLAVNIPLLLLYFGFLLAMSIRAKPQTRNWKEKREWYRKLHMRRSFCTLGLVAVLCLEFIFNIMSFSANFQIQDARSYPRNGEDTASIVKIMKQREGENSFYRAEATTHQTYNDGALNNYNGISTFSSAANVNITNYLRAMGLSAYKTYNRYAFEEGSPVANLFFNLKYLIERQGYVEENPYFTDLHNSGKVHLLENKYYLPLGFMTDPALAQLDFEEAEKIGYFNFQNKLLSQTLGQEVTPWKSVSSRSLRISASENVTLNNVTGSTANYKSNGLNQNGNYGSVYYSYTFEQSGFLCVRYGLDKNEYIVSYKPAGSDQFSILHRDTHNGLNYIASVCQVKPGDQIQITVKPKNTEAGITTISAFLLDQSVMDQAYAQLSKSTLNLTKVKDTHFEGTVQCQKDGLLYTSVPQNGNNWQVYVDGKKADITLIGDCMIGVLLTEGTHKITIKYQNNAFLLGAAISIVCLFLFAVICWFRYRSLTKKLTEQRPVQANLPSAEQDD